MMSASTNDVLNRLLVVHNRSLPLYLVDAAPWMRPGDEHAWETLALIAEDNRATVDRIAHLILDGDGEVDLGDFPLNFTRYNDLSMEFIVQEVLRLQVRDIVTIERCVEELSNSPLAKAVAQESYGAALAHLDTLKELIAGEPATSGHATV